MFVLKYLSKSKDLLILLQSLFVHRRQSLSPDNEILRMIEAAVFRLYAFKHGTAAELLGDNRLRLLADDPVEEQISPHADAALVSRAPTCAAC